MRARAHGGRAVALGPPQERHVKRRYK